MDEVVLDGKSYTASKQAAVRFGYTQDYVGQLIRKGLIEARRVAGRWYVYLPSLEAYKSNADTFRPEPPKYEPDPNAEASLDVDGKKYLSAASAAKLAEYNQDYVAQLARAGKIPSRQIGARWYVEHDSLLDHKKEKDAMLRAVQAASVGLKRPEPHAHSSVRSHLPIKSLDREPMVYKTDERPLFPEIRDSLKDLEMKAEPDANTEMPKSDAGSRIQIRVLEGDHAPVPMKASGVVPVKLGKINEVWTPGKTIFSRLFPAFTFSVLIVAAVSLGVYKSDTIYTLLDNALPNQSAAAGASAPITSWHAFLSKELVYIRGEWGTLAQ